VRKWFIGSTLTFCNLLYSLRKRDNPDRRQVQGQGLAGGTGVADYQGMTQTNSKSGKATSTPSAETTPKPAQPGPAAAAKVAEIGGFKGPEPTRYGDWEHNGRCSDF
jgi:hypothetical protein